MPIAKGQKIEAKYDGEKLYGLIKAGSNEAQIMAELGIQSKPTLKNHLLKLMNEKKEYLEIAGSSTRTRSSSPIYRGGKIMLTANMLTGIEFEEGQKFRIEKNDAGLMLIPV